MDSPSSADASRLYDGEAVRIIGQQTMRIFELESRNASLLAQLKAVQDNAASASSIAQNERFDKLAAEYGALSKRHQKMESMFKESRAQAKLATEKAHRCRDIALQWQTYYDRKMAERSRVHPERLPTSPDCVTTPNGSAHHVDKTATVDADATPRASRPASEPALGHDVVIPKLPFVLSGQAGLRIPRIESVRSSSRTLRVSSSQTTIEPNTGSDSTDMNSSPPPSKQDQGSDSEPVVVSARLLKRKRTGSVHAMPPPVRIKQEPNSPEQPVELRSDDYSSPVLAPHPLLRQETSDLDAFTTEWTTPRKHRGQRRAISEENRRPSLLIRRVSSRSEGDEPGIDDSGLVDRQRPVSAGLQAGEHLGPAIVVNDAQDNRASEDRASPLLPAQALRVLSVNVPPKARPVNLQYVGQREDREDGTAAKVAMLSEDGDDDTLKTRRAKFTSVVEDATPKSYAQRRLDTMLDGPSADVRHLVRNHTPQSAAVKSRKPLTPVSNPRPPQVPTVKASPRKLDRPTLVQPSNSKSAMRVPSPPKRNPQAFKRPRGLENSPPPIKPEDEPLRLRPLAALRMEDFKVNPKFMDADFAYVDTLRGRDQRRCMQSCTKPECCGNAFIKAAEIAGQVGSNKSDAEVLEAHLGPNWQQMMGAYPRERRNDILKQARVASFANQFGKHRHGFERHSTPPGFWRVDMPTTQEEAEDRAKADEMIRQKVEERWREAMRDNGGRWLFRDE